MTSEPRPFESRLHAPRACRSVLIVFSHLRWTFVFQRPQQLLSRLAAHVDVIVIEEPVLTEGHACFASSQPLTGVQVLTPQTPCSSPGFCDDQLPFIAELLRAFMDRCAIVAPLVWLYTPMALPLIEKMGPAAIVYDCMDDLASFRFAPAGLAEREHELLQIADVVMTGGPSLHEARRQHRLDIHCLPSAVDPAHFRRDNLCQSHEAAAAARVLHTGIDSPRIGFFGVIDERMDLELVAALADLRPDWRLILVGPVVKIDPASLPRRSNVLWVGMQAYDRLPYLIAHWDVAILPFALNEATRFISPTKTLEYLAAGVPVVSTPIRDVVALYGSVVRIAADAPRFVRQIGAALQESAQGRARRQRQVHEIVSRATWDRAAARVLQWLQPYLQPSVSAAVAASPGATSP